MMRQIPVLLVVMLLFFSSCEPSKTIQDTQHITIDSGEFYDAARNRIIPYAIYTGQVSDSVQPLILISHAYQGNQAGSYLHYSDLAGRLAEQGNFVLSIQQELPTDSMLPSQGDLYALSMPFWNQGAENIKFVLSELHKIAKNKIFPYQLDFKKVAVIGHAHGGDMAVLFAQKYPHLVSHIISLDHLHMPIPKQMQPKLLTLRSSEFVADRGVIPNPAELQKYPIQVIQMVGTKQSDFDDSGTIIHKKEIFSYITDFLGK